MGKIKSFFDAVNRNSPETTLTETLLFCVLVVVSLFDLELWPRIVVEVGVLGYLFSLWFQTYQNWRDERKAHTTAWNYKA